MKVKKLYCIEVKSGEQTQTYKFDYDWRPNLINVLMNCEAGKVGIMKFKTWVEENELLPPQLST